MDGRGKQMVTWNYVGSKSVGVNVQLGNPIANWSVEAPSTVTSGQPVTVTVKVYSYTTVQIKADVTLFGQTQTKTGTAYSTTTPGVLTFTFTAPWQAGSYTGTVKLYYSLGTATPT